MPDVAREPIRDPAAPRAHADAVLSYLQQHTESATEAEFALLLALSAIASHIEGTQDDAAVAARMRADLDWFIREIESMKRLAAKNGLHL